MSKFSLMVLNLVIHCVVEQVKRDCFLGVAALMKAGHSFLYGRAFLSWHGLLLTLIFASKINNHN